MASGNEENEHIPTLEELGQLKMEMFAASDRFRQVIAKERSNQEQENRVKTLETLKKEVLDMSDKFDYFVCLMLRDEKVTSEDISQNRAKPAKTSKVNSVNSFIQNNSPDSSMEEDFMVDVASLR